MVGIQHHLVTYFGPILVTLDSFVFFQVANHDDQPDIFLDHHFVETDERDHHGSLCDYQVVLIIQRCIYIVGIDVLMFHLDILVLVAMV